MQNTESMDQPTALKIIAAEIAQGYFYLRIRTGNGEAVNGLSWSRKTAVYEKTGRWCKRCNATTDLHIDHIWPRSKGGQNWLINLQVLCSKCNWSKSDTLELRSPEAVTTLVPLGPIAPKVFLIVIAGTVLVVSACLVAKWLMEDVDGDRRYVRFGRWMRQAGSGAVGRLGRARRSAGEATHAVAEKVQSATVHRIPGMDWHLEREDNHAGNEPERVQEFIEFNRYGMAEVVVA